VEVYERRLSKMEIRLRKQYAAMESLLGNLQSAQNSLLASLGTTA
jgi:flagellar capping protein FliD